MTAARTSIIGFTTIPAGERLARPTRRRVRAGRWERAKTRWETHRAWNARRRAEAVGAPATPELRDDFSIRHADAELRRF